MREEDRAEYDGSRLAVAVACAAQAKGLGSFQFVPYQSVYGLSPPELEGPYPAVPLRRPTGGDARCQASLRLAGATPIFAKPKTTFTVPPPIVAPSSGELI